MYRVLIVEDEPAIAETMKKQIECWGNEAACVTDFQNVVAEFASYDPHLVLMDIMLPFYNGYHWCTEIRKISDVPVIFVSSASDNMNIVMAMNMGGDDFITKPFSHTELLAKVSSLLRRYKEYLGKPAPSSVYIVDDLQVDLSARSIKRLGVDIQLTDTEYAILEFMLKNRGRTVTAAELYEQVCQEKFLPGSGNTVMVHVLNLRRKIEVQASNPRIIRTVWGKGYKID